MNNSSQIEIKFQSLRFFLWLAFTCTGIYFIANDMVALMLGQLLIVQKAHVIETERKAIERYYGSDPDAINRWAKDFVGYWRSWLRRVAAYWKSDDGKESKF